MGLEHVSEQEQMLVAGAFRESSERQTEGLGPQDLPPLWREDQKP